MSSTKTTRRRSRPGRRPQPRRAPPPPRSRFGHDAGCAASSCGPPTRVVPRCSIRHQRAEGVRRPLRRPVAQVPSTRHSIRRGNPSWLARQHRREDRPVRSWVVLAGWLPPTRSHLLKGQSLREPARRTRVFRPLHHGRGWVSTSGRCASDPSTVGSDAPWTRQGHRSGCRCRGA
jgi:hypothetical protein